jgi:hypothetical protein
MPALLLVGSVALALAAGLARAQDSCPSDCIVTGSSGNVYDLSALKGKTFTTVGDGGEKYTFTMCGQSPTSCPDDSAGVYSGMAVQTSGTSQCYVLGVYDSDQTCTWQESEPGSASILTLILENGSPSDCGGIDRDMAIKFNCPDDTSQLTPPSWTATNPEGTCDYEFEFDTCAVCPGGCTGGGGSSPTPGGAADGSGFGVLFLVFSLGVVLPLYLGMGAVYNYKVKGSRGADVLRINPGFWSAFWTNVKAGVVFAASFGSRVPDDGGAGPYAEAVDSSSVSYQEDSKIPIAQASAVGSYHA